MHPAASRKSIGASAAYSSAGSYIANVFDARVLFGPSFAMSEYAIVSIAVRALDPVNILQQEEKLR